MVFFLYNGAQTIYKRWSYKCFTCRAKLLNADWLTLSAFFLNHEGTFRNQKGMIWCIGSIAYFRHPKYTKKNYHDNFMRISLADLH